MRCGDGTPAGIMTCAKADGMGGCEKAPKGFPSGALCYRTSIKHAHQMHKTIAKHRAMKRMTFIARH